MNKQTATVNDFSAVHFAFLSVVCVYPVLGAPIGACTNGMPTQATHFKIGAKSEQITVAKNDIALGNYLQGGRKVTNACVFLKELINTVNDTAIVSAENKIS